MSIEIRSGSILDFEGDCIVNPANLFLQHGAGLAKVIADAAGDPSWDREQRAHPTIATGNVGVTSAGALPYKGIIHAVGPVWAGGGYCERQLLRSAYAESCAVAYQRGWRSIAFPAISCGLFRFPPAMAARLAMSAVKFYADELGMEVVFYPFEHETVFRKALHDCRQEALTAASDLERIRA